MSRDTTFFALKAAAADLIDRCGGQRRAGELIGVSQQHMSRICHRDDDNMLSIRAKLTLEADCGEPVLTRVEAELLGHRVEREGHLTLPATDGPYEAHAAVMAEVGDVCRAFSIAVADGKYSSADAVAVGRELADLRRQIERFERVHATLLAKSQ